MGVAGYLYALQVSQGHRALVFSEDVAQRLKVQHAEYLDVQEVRHVNGLSRALDPFPDRLGGWGPGSRRIQTMAEASRTIKGR